MALKELVHVGIILTGIIYTSGTLDKYLYSHVDEYKRY